MEAQKQFLGRGWASPVRLDPATALVATSEADDNVQQSILIILGTSPGERVMRPDFGCGIADMVFEVIDNATISRIATLVREALVRHEARIEVLEVNVDPYRAADGRLDISVHWCMRATNQVGNLVYPFYFREGGPL
jgi:uncharacterized protein